MRKTKVVTGFHEKEDRYSLAWVMGSAVFAVTLLVKLGLSFFQACSHGEALSPCLAGGFGSVGGDILNAFLDGAAVICFLELVIRKSESEAVAEHITKTLEFLLGGGNKAVFAALSPQTKEAMVRSSLESTLDGEFGTVFYDQIVAAYMNRKIHYRTDFHYHITCHDTLRLAPASCTGDDDIFLQLVKEQHIWVSQDLAYRMHSARQDVSADYLTARFAFNQHQLTRFIGIDGLFFREVIRIPQAARQILFSYSDDALKAFMIRVMGLRVNDIATGEELLFSVAWNHEETGGDDASTRFIEVKIPNRAVTLENAGCRLRFSLPHLRSDAAFLVTLPQPIKPKAEISFTKAPSMQNLAYIPFLSKFRDDTYAHTLSPPGDPEKITVSIRHWAFPTSGLMFIWKADQA